MDGNLICFYAPILVVQLVKNCRHFRRPQFDPWVRNIPWRREWQPTPVFLPGEFHGQRNLMGYTPRDHERAGLSDSPSFSFTYNNETTEKHDNETTRRNTEKKRGDCQQPKTTKKVTEDGIWGPDRRRILSTEGRRDGDKDVCRCRQGSPGLSGKSGGGRQEGI